MWDAREREILSSLDAALGDRQARTVIDELARQVERELGNDPTSLLTWRPIPLTIYSRPLPDGIRSSWVFVLRAHTVSGAERHPNSHQRVVSYRGSADLQIWEAEHWASHVLTSDPHTPLENRWASIPPLTWHQGVMSSDNWIVVSFHTVPAHELIEERPDPNDVELTQQRHYWSVPC